MKGSKAKNSLQASDIPKSRRSSTRAKDIKARRHPSEDSIDLDLDEKAATRTIVGTHWTLYLTLILTPVVVIFTMSQQELYIPPNGIYFRLLGYNSQQVIYSRTHREPEVGQHPVEEQYDDQFFTLIHGTGDRKGTYAIKSKVTGNVLFSRSHMEPNVGHVAGNGQYNDK